MSICLPPGTSDFNQTGTLIFRIVPIYINTSLPSIRYSLKLWGFADQIKMQRNEDVFDNSCMLKSQRVTECYEKVFRVTTNLSKLTSYIRDMAVMIIVVSDARTNKETGLGYVKLKSYIINDLLSQFEQKVEIVAHCENKYKKLVIGELILKLKLDVPVNAITTKTKIFNPTTSQMQIDVIPNIIPKNDRMAMSKRNKRMEESFRAHEQQQNKMAEREGHMRKIVIQPNVFDEHQTNPELKQFTISKHARGADNRAIIPRDEDDERDNDVRDMVLAMRTKPKVTKENVLDFLEQDSINMYPDIDQLVRKYGNNNVCVQRMKLKYDQARYLGKKQKQINTHQTAQNKGFLINLSNVRHLISTPVTGMSDFHVSHLVSDRDNTVINSLVIKQLNQAGFYIKYISAGNAIDFDNKLYKGRVIIRNNNIQGQPHKVYLKRKDNNKKIAEFDVKIQNLGLNAIQENNQIKQNKKQHSNIKNKAHFYVSVRPTNQSKYKQFTYEIHPQSQKQGAKGKKMIFTADNKTQKINIKIGLINTQQVTVTMDPSIKMKQQNVTLHDQQFKIFMASADGIDNLMKMVVLYDGNPKSIQSVNEPESRGSRIVTPGQTPEVQTQRNLNQVDDKFRTRQDKLKLLYECFECLIQTNNTECMQIIKKLSSPVITHDQQLPLFQKLCASAGATQPEATTFLAFKQLLHGQFSMFWKCFEEYKLLNQMYARSLRLCYKEAENNLLACIGQLSGDASGYYGRKHEKQGIKIMQKLIDKLYRNRQTLFGLIPYQICKNIVNQYLDDRFKQPPRQADPATKQQPQVEQVAKNSEIKQKGEGSWSKLQALKQSLSRILCLLCRYTGNDNETHSIKIQQLAAVLLTSPQQYHIPVNEHQVLAVWAHSKQDMQLLFEVTCSCVDQKISKEGCSILRDLINFYDKVETEMSSPADEEQRISTEGNNTLHVYTEQPQRIHTEEIAQDGKKEPAHIPQNTSKQQVQLKNIKLYLTQLVLNPDRNQYATVASTKNAVVEILDSDTKICKHRLSQSELPKAINVINMKDYLVVVSLQDQHLEDGQDVLQGVFIANATMDRILLYSSQKGADAKDVGYISTAFEAEHRDRDDDDVVVIQVTKQVTMPAHKQIEQNRIHLEQVNKQMEEEERNRLTKQVKGKTIKQRAVAYKILNAYPAPRSSQQYVILLEGAERAIRYPNYYATGIIKNQDIDSDHLNIVLQDQTRATKHEEKLPKTIGVHDVCFNKSDGTVRCVLTIQLSQYIGEQATNIKQSAIQRLIYMNIYHMELFAKLSLLYEDKRTKFTIVVTSESNIDPVFVKQFQIYSKSPCLGKQNDQLRHVWIGLTTKVQASKKFDICIYSNTRGGKYLQDNLIAHFVFKMKYHPEEVGIFENKGYLIDERGLRLAITMIEINYNDMFSKDEVGREKFQNLLSVFTTENILKISESSPQNTEQLKSKIRSNFGFNNTQIYLLFELQSNENQILNMITNWDINVLLSGQSINLQSYSIQDLFTEYQIYDFTNSGIIPYSKAQLVDLLVFKSKDKNHRVNIQKCLIQNRDGWLIDLNSKQDNGDIDYMLILWCLRRFAVTDDYFIKGAYDYSISKQKHKNTLNDTTQNNNTSLPHNNQQSISKIKAAKVEMLGFKNLKVDGQPATLIFYLNGQKVAEPVPRCFTCEYQQPKTIITTWPIVLEIYNKKYGIRELYNQQLVGTVKVYEQKVHVLGGQIYFLIEQQGNDNSLIHRPSREKIENTKQKQDLNNTNRFRQSRRQKWQNSKQSRSDTQKIADILSRVTA